MWDIQVLAAIECLATYIPYLSFMSTQIALSLVTIVMVFGGFMQAKRHNAAAMQVGIMSVSQPPLEAAPTPQGYAQRHSMGHVPVQNQGQGSSDGAGQQGHGQGQQMMDSSRPRNADGDQGGDDMGGSAEQQPITTLSQVRCRIRRISWSYFRLPELAGDVDVDTALLGARLSFSCCCGHMSKAPGFEIRMRSRTIWTVG